MKLDPQVHTLLTAINAAGFPSFDNISVDFAREVVESRYAQMRIPVREVFSVENISIRNGAVEIPVRIYKPSNHVDLPVLVFFHGGGWVLFHLDDYDSICTNLCMETGCIVVSVEYRLSPESKFPAALDDCMDSVQWAFENVHSFGGDPSRIIVAGDSAGGNLAASVALKCRNEEGPNLLGQVLIYPATNYFEPGTPSLKKFSEGYSLTFDALKWFWHQYLVDASQATHPYASPLKADDLSHLPDALVILSGFDPLFDEGIQYAERLKQSGCNVTLSLYEDMIHGFLSYLGYIDRAQQAITEISTWLRRQFGLEEKGKK